MGNFVSISIPCDPWMNKVSQWLDEKGSYTQNLKKNLVALETTMEELKARRDDLLRRIIREEDKGLQRLSEVQVWLNSVGTIENIVHGLLTTRDAELQRLCLCGFCSKSLISSNRYGKRVFMELSEVEKLKSSGVFAVVAEKASTLEVVERPLHPIIVGQGTMLETAWNHLKEDEVGIMGMYGMGGVGKTTLLTQLNNKFGNERSGFDFVIWVVVSKELQVEKVQDHIAKKLGLGGVGWDQNEESQKADVIYNFLRKRKFVLFLDDIWEEVDLGKIGVPFPTTQNRCKVAFTTRSKDVCARMGVEDPMEVQCLAEKDAFDLFQKKVGQITLGSHPEIPDLAKIVARKCYGLPLTLDVIGKTMSGKRTVQEWHHAIDVLNSYAIEFAGMEDKILPILKYSYDNLRGEQVKSCLLYCSLFPEDAEIPVEKLIEYWIGEGIINGSKGIERAKNKGYEIIGSLVRASLLMEVQWDGEIKVRMHDVVREMSLWIATDLGREKEAFIVRAGVRLNVMPEVENWNVVRRMSLMNNMICNFSGSPECRELETLLLQRQTWYLGTYYSKFTISSEFFKFMPKLVVLDLSDNNELSELPEGISKLVSLQYLNLSRTSIRRLPRGLQELKKLIHLDLEYNSQLESIVGISSLHNLKVLKLFPCGISLDLHTAEELESLKQLEIFTIRIRLPSCVENFLSSHRLTRCTQFLDIFGVDMESSGIALPLNMGKLREFDVRRCTISEICINSKTVSPLHNPRNPCFFSLSKVFISMCKGLKELTWLMFAPNLETLTVSEASEVEDIINKEKACECEDSGIVPFPKLIKLSLQNLPELKNIYWSPLPFPCLERIDVVKCPNLKKLPLDSQSGKQGENRLIISYGEKEWIKGVEWEDEATKTRFLSSCRYMD